MKTKPSFTHALLAGFLLSATGAAVFHTLILFMSLSAAAILTICTIAIAYSAYLCASTKDKTGWLSIFILLSLLAGLSLVFSVSALMFLITSVLVVSIFRITKTTHNWLPGTIELLIAGISSVLAFATFIHTHSIFLSLWSFFLVHAVLVFVGESTKLEKGQMETKPNDTMDRFNKAHACAEANLKHVA